MALNRSLEGKHLLCEGKTCSCSWHWNTKIKKVNVIHFKTALFCERMNSEIRYKISCIIWYDWFQILRCARDCVSILHLTLFKRLIVISPSSFICKQYFVWHVSDNLHKNASKACLFWNISSKPATTKNRLRWRNAFCCTRLQFFAKYKQGSEKCSQTHQIVGTDFDLHTFSLNANWFSSSQDKSWMTVTFFFN